MGASQLVSLLCLQSRTPLAMGSQPGRADKGQEGQAQQGGHQGAAQFRPYH